jgi:peptidoglycan/LPS O-acetylase OafA/YrhL
MTGEAQQREFLPGIEVLRGVAAGTVVVHHMWSLGNRPQFRFDFILEGFGGWGVNLFFLLSGYLLADHFWRGQGAQLKPFYVRRFMRIGPAYYVNIGLLFLFFASHSFIFTRDGLRQVLANATFVHYLRPETASSANVNGALWTLSNEFVLYLVMPVLALAVLRWSYKAVIAFIALGMGYRLWSARWGDGLLNWYFPNGADRFNAELYMIRQFPGLLPIFALGIGLRWWQRSDTRPAAYFRTRARFRPGVLILLLLPSVLFLQEVVRSSNYLHWVWFTSYDFVMVVLLAPALIYAARPHEGASSRVSRPLQWLGERSYGLYLWHFPIILAVYGMGPFLFPADTSGIAYKVTLIVVLSLLFAHLSFVLVERPAQGVAKRWLRKPAVQPAAQPVAQPVPQ